MGIDGGVLRRSAAFVTELVLPVDCAGCGRAGPALCFVCRTRLVPKPVVRSAGSIRIASGLVYDGVARDALLAFKNEGRTDLAPPLAGALRAALIALLDESPESLPALVPMPGTARSRHERGYEPVRVLLRRARLPAVDGLQLIRRPRDQTTLGREARIANLEGGMRGRLAGRAHRRRRHDRCDASGGRQGARSRRCDRGRRRDRGGHTPASADGCGLRLRSQSGEKP